MSSLTVDIRRKTSHRVVNLPDRLSLLRTPSYTGVSVTAKTHRPLRDAERIGLISAPLKPGDTHPYICIFMSEVTPRVLSQPTYPIPMTTSTSHGQVELSNSRQHRATETYHKETLVISFSPRHRHNTSNPTAQLPKMFQNPLVMVPSHARRRPSSHQPSHQHPLSPSRCGIQAVEFPGQSRS